MAFALGFVGAQDYSSLVVFIPPPRKKGNISWLDLFALSCESKSEYIIYLLL